MERYPETIMVRVSEEVKEKIISLADEEERTVANMTRVLIHEALKHRETAKQQSINI